LLLVARCVFSAFNNSQQTQTNKESSEETNALSARPPVARRPPARVDTAVQSDVQTHQTWRQPWLAAEMLYEFLNEQPSRAPPTSHHHTFLVFQEEYHHPEHLHQFPRAVVNPEKESALNRQGLRYAFEGLETFVQEQPTSATNPQWIRPEGNNPGFLSSN
jgi:hypothetical protein